MEKEIRFMKEKETKHTIRFTEEQKPGEPLIVGTLYVQKWFAGDATTITLNIKTDR
uniref:Uncharacterized protein n=2 Tax=viral metagenome TaxID=1070528 RepID=A0A6H2A4U6_9ZZZZ